MSSVDSAPTVSIKTIGCRLNQAETARMTAVFAESGYNVLNAGDPADVCVVHTCAITASAERKCMQFARAVKRESPATILVLAGCAVETSGHELLEKTGADLLAGQEDKFRIPSLLAASAGLSCAQPPETASVLPRFQTTRALVKVQDGCNFNCSYCIVPRARGLPVSRPAAEIVDEVRRLADAGFREVVLTGANLGCYRDGRGGLVKLMASIERIAPLKRIRLSSIEVSTTERDVIRFMRDSSKLCRYVHIPLQSGSDRILQAMGRRYSASDYRELVTFALDTVPRLGLGTDVIAGFPGEDDDAFDETRTLVQGLPFSNLHVFPYSRRKATAAADLPGQLPGQVKKTRVAELTALGNRKKREFAEKLVGLPVQVLIEECATTGGASGWTGEYVRALVTGNGTSRNDLVEFVPHSASNGILLCC